MGEDEGAAAPTARATQEEVARLNEVARAAQQEADRLREIAAQHMQTLEESKERFRELAREGLAFTEEALPQTERRSEEWQRVWMLSLGAGNAAGLLAIGTAAVNVLGKPGGPPQLAYWGVLLPPMWLFAAGLTCAGALPLLRHWRERAVAKFTSRSQQEFKQQVQGSWVAGTVKPKGFLFPALCELFLGFWAPVCFVVGLWWPVVGVTLFLR